MNFSIPSVHPNFSCWAGDSFFWIYKIPPKEKMCNWNAALVPISRAAAIRNLCSLLLKLDFCGVQISFTFCLLDSGRVSVLPVTVGFLPRFVTLLGTN